MNKLEEIKKKYYNNPFHRDDYFYNEYVNELKKENESLIKKYNGLNSHLRLLQKNVFEIVEENENLKCCGNCENFMTYCITQKSYEYCKDWQSGNLTRKEREI